MNESAELSEGLSKLLQSAQQAKESVDNVKFAQLPSLMEMESEMDGYDEMFDEFVTGVMQKNYPAAPSMTVLSNKLPTAPKSTCPNAKSSVTTRIIYRSISSSMDQRLAVGLETNIETTMRRWTLSSATNLFASLPTYPNQQNHFNLLDLPAASLGVTEIGVWPEHILQAWSNDGYQSNQSAVQMLVSVFDTIFEDLDVADSWLNLEQVLQLWLTLNIELSDTNVTQTGSNSNRGSQSSSSNGRQSDAPKIPFSMTAVQGLLSALNCHAGISLKAWALSFQCLIKAANDSEISTEMGESDEAIHMSSYIVNNPQFGQMLYRFYSSADPTSSPDKQCVCNERQYLCNFHIIYLLII